MSRLAVAAETPHLVVSTTLGEATWPTARIVRDLDELRLIVHPVLAGGGQSFFGGIGRRPALGLVAAEPTASGRVNLSYRFAAT